MPGSLQLLLEELLPLPDATSVMKRIEAAVVDADPSGIALGTFVLRAPHGGGPDRHAALSLHRDAEAQGLPLLLLLRDVTALEGLQETLAQTRESLDTALAVLRSSPQGIRMFLSASVASVSALRATMKLPARDQEAVHAKLSRLKEGADQLADEAKTAGLAAVTAGLRRLRAAPGGTARKTGAQRRRSAAARAAARPDRLGGRQMRRASRNSATSRRRRRARRAPPRRRMRGRRRRIGHAAPSDAGAASCAGAASELGTLVKLQVQNAGQVPPGLRRDVDDMLQHLLRNAVEHGIETPEARLAAGKPASGMVTVKFEDKGRHGVNMTVRDDGRGFDIERIGRAAVRSGLVSEESLLEYDPGEMVGLIFKPTFSTEHLDGEAGRGRGMSFLRRTVTRLGGQITVATKPGSLHAVRRPAARAVRCNDEWQGVEPEPGLTSPRSGGCNAPTLQRGAPCIWWTPHCSTRRPAVASGAICNAKHELVRRRGNGDIRCWCPASAPHSRRAAISTIAGPDRPRHVQLPLAAAAATLDARCSRRSSRI